MVLVGYARVSTEGQSLDPQIEALGGAGVEAGCLYVETASGRKARPELANALKALRPGDVLVATKLDRLARSLKHLIEVVERVHEAGAALRMLDQAIDTTTPSGRLMLHVLGAVAEMEAELISERTRVALAARGHGQRGGRPRALSARQAADVQRRVADGQPVAEVARVMQVSRQTVYRALSGTGL